MSDNNGQRLPKQQDSWLNSVLNDNVDTPPPVDDPESDCQSIHDTFDDAEPPAAAEVKIAAEAEVEVQVAEAEAEARVRWRWPDAVDAEAGVRTSRQILPSLDPLQWLEPLDQESSEKPCSAPESESIEVESWDEDTATDDGS